MAFAGSAAGAVGELAYLGGTDIIEAGILKDRGWRSPGEYTFGIGMGAGFGAVPGLISAISPRASAFLARDLRSFVPGRGALKPTLSQVRALRNLGVDKAARRRFFQGEMVHGSFTTKSGASVEAFLQMQNDRLVSQLFYITSNKGATGTASRAFVQFRHQSRTLARSLGLRKLELQGGSVMNPDVERFLLRQGFKSKTMPVPDELGGGSQEVLYRLFDLD
jgi:hypothetical protein